jgi:hypothetical protein
VYRWFSSDIWSVTSWARAPGERLLGLERLDVHVRVSQLEQDRAGIDRRSRTHQDSLDAAGGERRDVADLLGHELPRSPHLAEHRSSLHLVDRERGALHAGSRGLDARERDGREDEATRQSADQDAAVSLLRGLTGDVHVRAIAQPTCHGPRVAKPPFAETVTSSAPIGGSARGARLWDGASRFRTVIRERPGG